MISSSWTILRLIVPRPAKRSWVKRIMIIIQLDLSGRLNTSYFDFLITILLCIVQKKPPKQVKCEGCPALITLLSNLALHFEPKISTKSFEICCWKTYSAFLTHPFPHFVPKYGVKIMKTVLTFSYLEFCFVSPSLAVGTEWSDSFFNLLPSRR